VVGREGSEASPEQQPAPVGLVTPAPSPGAGVAGADGDDATQAGPVPVSVVPPPPCTGAPVTVTQSGALFTLDNGDVRVVVNTSDATLPSFRFHGVEMMNTGGYYSFGTNIYTAGPFRGRLAADPKTNGGEVAEVSMTTSWNGGAGVVPLDIDVRFALTRCSPGVYEYVGLTHPENYPAFSPGEMRINHYVRWDDVFDWYAVDDVRRGPFPSQDDVTRGAAIPGAPVEVRQYRTGPFGNLPGWQKYDASVEWGEGNVYGWSSSSQRKGLWIINPSNEYLAGGPLKTELTVHDGGVGRGALLNYWGGTHFNGGFEPVLTNQRREKVMGPWLLYANETELTGKEGHDKLWADAKDRLSWEKGQWPYTWESDPRYLPRAARGSVSGMMSFTDPEQTELTSAHAWVGLAGPPVAGAPNFEHQGWDYQYWTIADAAGRFSFAGVRPGDYTLHAFAEGIHGVYMGQPNAVRVESGTPVEVGEVAWQAERLGPTVWEIGTPDRTPREFYRGDQAWHYGTNLLFPSDFPQGVNFTVGTSDPSTAWNYLQPGGTWTVNFNLASIPGDVGGASLVLDVAGTDGVTVQATVNGAPVGSAPYPYNDGSISRDQPHGVLQSGRIAIPRALLRPGANALTLSSNRRLMWDYLRLEWVRP
jgi:rhamnogalacturonan endolyase